MYRFCDAQLQVLLGHPGGPFHRNRDSGAWSIPKGEFSDDESPREAAVREFREELGVEVLGEMVELKPVVQKSGKKVFSWAVEGNFSPQELLSNTFQIEWPPKSGKLENFPELDRVEWFSVDQAIQKIIPGQAPIVNELNEILTTRQQK